MNVGKIQLDVVQDDIAALDARMKVSDCKEVNQETVRETIARALVDAQNKKCDTIAFTDLGVKNSHFPAVGVAKIMVQEIINYKRVYDEPSLNKVTICLNDEDMFGVFDKTVRGYLHHLREDLGWGPYVTVDIIIEINDGIVLIERSNPPYGWALPGGFLDYGESLEHAAVREAKEETNCDLDNLRQFHAYSKPGRDPRFQTVTTVFTATGRGNPKSGDDAKDLKIVPRGKLLDLEYAFDHKGIIKEYLGKQ